MKGVENLTPDALSRYPTEGVDSSIAISKDNCAAGWMVLVGRMYDFST